jgi:hypothetical protein
LQQVIQERAADPDMQHIPGGKTGLLVHTTKAIGAGRTQQLIDEYTLDAVLLREAREHEKQAAQEVGDWVEKNEQSGPNGGPVRVEVVGVASEDV